MIVRNQRVASHRRQQKIERKCCIILPKEKALPGINSEIIAGGHFQNHLKDPQKDQKNSLLFHEGRIDIQIKVITTGTEGVEAAAEVEAQGGEGEVTVQGMREMKLVIKLRKGNTANLSEKFLAREKRHNNYQLGVAVILGMKKTWKKALPEERRPGASLQIGIVRLLSGGIHLKDAVKHLIRGEGVVHVEKGGFLVKGNLQKGPEGEITGRAH